MEECSKCGQKDLSVTFMPKGEFISWNQHRLIENMDQFTRNDRYYYFDKVEKQCLILKYKTCGHKIAIKTKDGK